ncbi:AraC family transcriptional regulator [Filimonas lacunae]|nr:AraC family transcriptional regulator [Filimonas lacunae]
MKKNMEPVNDSVLPLVDEVPGCYYIWHTKAEFRHKMHTHNKGQLTYFQGGSAFLHTNDKSYFLPARHYVWVPPGMPHYLEQRDTAYSVRNLYFPALLLKKQPFFDKLGIYPASNLIYELLLYTENWIGNIHKGAPGYDLLTAIKSLLPEVSKQPLPIALPTTDNLKLRPVLRYLHENISEKLSMPELAPQFGFSERSLYRLFRTEMDISFLQYLKMLRVIKGIEMLLKADQNISEIAFKTGYESISAFSNTFQQIVGMRPSEFKL